MRSLPRSVAAFAGLFVLLGSGCVHAPARVDYVIEGRVVDAESGAPLPGVEVHAHWPDRMPVAPGSALFATVRTGPLGRFWVSKTVLRPGSFCACVACGRPMSVREGNAVGTAITVVCPSCAPTSVGLGEKSLDFLAHGPRGSVQVMRSVARPPDLVMARQNGSTVVRYQLPDIPVQGGQSPQSEPPAGGRGMEGPGAPDQTAPYEPPAQQPPPSSI